MLQRFIQKYKRNKCFQFYILFLCTLSLWELLQCFCIFFCKKVSWRYLKYSGYLVLSSIQSCQLSLVLHKYYFKKNFACSDELIWNIHRLWKHVLIMLNVTLKMPPWLLFKIKCWHVILNSPFFFSHMYLYVKVWPSQVVGAVLMNSIV